jgi:hypothetical protein
VRRKKRLEKVECEICGSTDRKILHKHHIIERTDPNTSHDDENLAILCPNCHSKIHVGEIEVVGIFPSTKQPYRRTLVYKEGGVSNVPGLETPYYQPEPKAMRWHGQGRQEEDE